MNLLYSWMESWPYSSTFISPPLGLYKLWQNTSSVNKTFSQLRCRLFSVLWGRKRLLSLPGLVVGSMIRKWKKMTVTLVALHHCIIWIANLHLPADFDNTVFQTPPKQGHGGGGGCWVGRCLALQSVPGSTWRAVVIKKMCPPWILFMKQDFNSSLIKANVGKAEGGETYRSPLPGGPTTELDD